MINELEIEELKLEIEYLEKLIEIKKKKLSNLVPPEIKLSPEIVEQRRKEKESKGFLDLLNETMNKIKSGKKNEIIKDANFETSNIFDTETIKKIKEDQNK